jgi:hypothetical protein
MQVISSAGLKSRIIDTPDGQFKITDIIGRNGQIAPGPQCFLTEVRSKGLVVRPHFHRVEQFQLFVCGSGYFGKTPIPHPVVVHYADRFTPYGPIRPDDEGFQYMTLRLRADPGPRPMPEARAEKTEPTGRSLTCAHRTDGMPVTERATSDLIAPQGDGLAVRVLQGPAGEALTVEPPADGPAHYYVVLDGSAIHAGREYPRLSTFFVAADDPEPQVAAGAEGLTLLLAAFPRRALT